ncbi:unnamed protein product [Mortierella alpina]
MTHSNTPELVLVENHGPTTVITINRPHKRNCVNGPTARALYQAFLAFDADPVAKVAILTGAGGNFCAGAGRNVKTTVYWPHSPSLLYFDTHTLMTI